MFITLAGAFYYSLVFLTVAILLGIITSYEPLRYYVKIYLITLAAVISTTVYFPFAFLRIGDWRNGLIPTCVVRKVARLLGLNMQVRGKENIVKDTGSIVLANHQSLLDFLIVAELWPVLERCTVIVKKEILYYGPLGLGCWLAGIIFIDRKKSKESQDTLKAAVKPIQDRRANVLISPEGRRNNKPTLLPFKKGPFHLAIDSQLPLQPVVTSKYYFLNAKRKIFNSGTSYITILPPIPTKGLTKEDLPKLMEDAYRIMNKSFIELSQAAINEHVNFSDD